MPAAPAPHRGARYESGAHFQAACDLHAATSSPPFLMSVRKQSNDTIVYGCEDETCTFAFWAALRNVPGMRCTVYNNMLQHTCGLPSPDAPAAPANQARTGQPSLAPAPPAASTSTAPSSSALSAHWSWLNFGKGGPVQSPIQSAAKTFPSFKKLKPDSPDPPKAIVIPPDSPPRSPTGPPNRRIYISSDDEDEDKLTVKRDADSRASSLQVQQDLLIPPSVEVPSREASSEPEWPPTEVKTTILPPQIDDIFPSRDAARTALDRAGAAAQPPFTCYTARSTNAPADKAFIIWHCQHRQRNGAGCTFVMRAISLDSTLTRWQITQANYEHANHPPPGWKAQRKKPSHSLAPVRDLTPAGDTSDAGSDVPIKGRRRAAPRDRPTPEYVPSKKRKLAGGAGDGPGGYVPATVPDPVGPLGLFLAGLHPMLGNCGPALEAAGIENVELLLTLTAGELQEVLKPLPQLKAFHRATIANRVGQVRDGRRDNPLQQKKMQTQQMAHVSIVL